MISARRAALGTLNLALVAAIYVAWSADPAHELEQALRASPKPSVSSPSVAESTKAFSDSKPLFRPRPPAPAAAEQAPIPVTPSAPNFRLAGIVWGETEKIAIVQMVDDGKNRRIRVGEAIGDWTLKHLTVRTAIVEAGTTQVELKLAASSPTQ